MEEGEVISEASQETELEEGEIKDENLIIQDKIELSLGVNLNLDLDNPKGNQVINQQIKPVAESETTGSLSIKATNPRKVSSPGSHSKSKPPGKSAVRTKTRTKCSKGVCTKRYALPTNKSATLNRQSVRKGRVLPRPSHSASTRLSRPRPCAAPSRTPSLKTKPPMNPNRHPVYVDLDAREPPTIRSVDKDASYEDLLEQYRRIKLELNHIKKEEKHSTELPKKPKELPLQNKPANYLRKSPSKSEMKRETLSVRRGRRRKSFGKPSNSESEKPIKLVSAEEEEDLMELRRMALESRAMKLARRKSSNLDLESVKGTEKKETELCRVDNYEQVDMDLDSDFLPSSPATHNLCATDLSEVEMDTGDDNNSDEEDEKALREQLLKAIESKKTVIGDIKVPTKENIPESETKNPLVPIKSAEPENNKLSDEVLQERSPLEEISQRVSQQKIPSPAPIQLKPIVSSTKLAEPKKQPATVVKSLPQRCQKIVINLADDSSSSESESPDSPILHKSSHLLAGLDAFIAEARLQSDIKMDTSATAVSQLSKAQQLEYRKLKEELARRKQDIALKSDQSGSATANNSESEMPSGKKETENKLTNMELKIRKERSTLMTDMKRMAMLKNMVTKRKKLIEDNENQVRTLKEQLALAEKDVANNKKVLGNLNGMVEGIEKSVTDHKNSLTQLENECLEAGTSLHGSGYELPTINTPIRKRTASNSILMAAKKARLEPGVGTITAAIKNSKLTAEKIRLKKLEREVAKRLEELKKSSKTNVVNSLLIKPQNIRPGSNHKLITTLSTQTIRSSGVMTPQRFSPLMLTRVVSPVPIQSKPKPLNARTVPTDSKTLNTRVTPELLSRSQPNMSTPGLNCDQLVPKKNLAKDFFLDDICKLPKVKPLQSTPLSATTSKVHQALLSTRLRLSVKSKLNSVPLNSSTNAPSQAYISFSENDQVCPDLSKTELHVEDESINEKIKPYVSPLLHLKSYRLNPSFKNVFAQDFSDSMHANKINCYLQLCLFDLTGTCHDDQCKWQHEAQYSLTHVEKLIDLLSYAPQIGGVKDDDDSEVIRRKLVSYVKKCIGRDKKLSMERRCQKIIVTILKHLKLAGPYYASEVLERCWKIPHAKCTSKKTDDLEISISKLFLDKNSMNRKDEVEHNYDVASIHDRYFKESVRREVTLEEMLEKDPGNSKLWLELAECYLNSRNEGSEVCLTRALNTMSRALETNQNHPDLWQYYLELYSQHPESSDILSMCQQALEYTSSYRVWWQYLEMSRGYKEKVQICVDLLGIMSNPEKDISVRSDPLELSHSLLEITFYLCQLSLLSGHVSVARKVFQEVLSLKSGAQAAKSPQTKLQDLQLLPFLELLSASDKVLFWLVYVYFLSFSRLPNFLFQLESDNPGVLVKKEHFVMCWPKLNEESYGLILCALNAALESCKENDKLDMLYINIAELEFSMGRFDKCVAICQKALIDCPNSIKLWLYFGKLYSKKGLWTEAKKVFNESLQQLPNDLELCYTLAVVYVDGNDKPEAAKMLTQSVKQFFVSSRQLQDADPLLLYRHILKYDNHQDQKIHHSVPKLKPNLKIDSKTLGRLWLSYGLLLHCLEGSMEQTLKVMKYALQAIDSQEMIQVLWEQYLRCLMEFDTSKLEENVFACVESLPSSFNLPFEPKRQYLNFDFHNRIVEFYCDSLSNTESKLEATKHFFVVMPKNIKLIARMATYLTELREMESALQFLELNLTPCIANEDIWKTCIRLAIENRNHEEVGAQYHKALTALPYSTGLWNDYVTYEQSLKHTDELKAASKICSELGVFLNS